MEKKRSNYSIGELTTGGGYGGLNPMYGNVYTPKPLVEARNLGTTTNPGIANQLQEVSKVLNTGMVPIEVGAISQDLWNQIPEPHFDEMRRLAQLNKANITVHAPIVDPSGMKQGQWSEIQRRQVENQLNGVFDQAMKLKPKGQDGPIVTIHGAEGTQGTIWKIDEKGNKVEDTITLYDQIANRISQQPAQEEVRYTPFDGTKKEDIRSPKKQVDVINLSNWGTQVDGAITTWENAERILSGIPAGAITKHAEWEALSRRDPKAANRVIEEMENTGNLDTFNRVSSANEFLNQAQRTTYSLFDHAVRLSKGDEKALERLENASKIYKEILGVKEVKMEDGRIGYAEEGKGIPVINRLNALRKLNQELEQINPKQFIPVADFVKDQASQTFANVAFNAYKKYGTKAPTMAIENVYPELPFAMGDEMGKLIENTRERFVKKAMEEKGESREKAEKAAEKLIGVTFDIGHLNMNKKYGFKDEDLVKEAKEFAKYVKKMHLTDNFGYTDSHLPTGMGNVPTKDLLEVVQAAGFKDGVHIMESGGFIQQFGFNPVRESFEGVGAGLYGGGKGPYWADPLEGLVGNYGGGMGEILPQVNFQMYGASFTGLPKEIGAQMGAQGPGSRFSGRPME